MPQGPSPNCPLDSPPLHEALLRVWEGQGSRKQVLFGPGVPQRCAPLESTGVPQAQKVAPNPGPCRTAVGHRSGGAVTRGAKAWPSGGLPNRHRRRGGRLSSGAHPSGAPPPSSAVKRLRAGCAWLFLFGWLCFSPCPLLALREPYEERVSGHRLWDPRGHPPAQRAERSRCACTRSTSHPASPGQRCSRDELRSG